MALFSRIILISLVFLTACAQNLFWDLQQESESRVKSRSESESHAYSETESATSTFKTSSHPWQTWEDGRTLAGKPLASRYAERADEQFTNGAFDEALQNYYLALGEAVELDQVESLKLRIASTQLAKDNAGGALGELSSYYKERGLSVSFVRAESAIVFAYIYGRLGNFKQSLAWSAQALSAAKTYQLKEIANEGVASLLKHLQSSDLSELESAWGFDPSLPTLFAAERSRRLQSGAEVYSFYDNPRYWARRQQVVAEPSAAAVVDNGQGKAVAIALPLTGRYARFGKKVRQGIELALSGNRGLYYEFFDTGGTASRAGDVCQHIASTGRYQVILGPLLYSPANAIAKCARQNRLKQIAFTKKADFQTGGGVYTLGVTVEAQVKSLLKAVTKKLGLKKIAIVYPTEDQSAATFANRFRAELRRLNLEPAFEYSYYKNPMPDFADLNREIVRYNPQAIFVIDDLNMATRISGSIGEELGRGRRLLGTAEWSNEDLMRRSSNALRQAVFVSPYLSSVSSYSKKFNTSYQGVYGEEPDFLAAQGYDAAVMVENILQQSPAGSSWQQAAINFKQYQGLTGEISFSSGGKLNRTLKVVEYIDGHFRELSRGAAPKFVYRGNNELKAERKN